MSNDEQRVNVNQPSKTDGASVSRESRKHRHAVLVVEDNDLNRELLSAILEDEYDVLQAEDGEVGLQVLAQHCTSIDCVLLDVNMPVCDGYEFLERSCTDERINQIPVIVTTANNTMQDELKCLNLGASDFVKKPYEPEIVKSRVRSIIRLHESIDTLSAVEIDDLTGAYTKQAFALHARELIEANPDKEIVFFAAKLENYRLLNTIYGRNAGDEVIKYLGTCFLAHADNGILSRDEADRFVSVVALDEAFDSKTFLANAQIIAENAPRPNVDLKYGVYVDVDTSLSIEDLMDRTFAALKTAEMTPNRLAAYFAGEAHLRMTQEQKLEAAFESALANGEFVVYYQPKCNVQTEKLEAAEALVRWKMPVDADGERVSDPALAVETKMVSPGVFVPLFERDGLIADLDIYMFRQVCKVQSDRLKAGQTVVPISINMSRINLYRHDIVETYVNIAKEADIPFDLVPIELTESASIDDEQVHDSINALADAGFPIHLDDFGSGFSSYVSLASLPISTLKLDKTLIDKYGERAGKIIIGTSISLAKALNMTVVAEGVETADQVEFLRGTAGDLIQGYYFSAPVPYERFSEMLEAGHA